MFILEFYETKAEGFAPSQEEMDEGSYTHGGMRNAYKILFGKPEKKRPFWVPRRGWEELLKWRSRI
jgi:hypothetical protein